jgi:hypothetical protein
MLAGDGVEHRGRAGKLANRCAVLKVGTMRARRSFPPFDQDR